MMSKGTKVSGHVGRFQDQIVDQLSIKDKEDEDKSFKKDSGAKRTRGKSLRKDVKAETSGLRRRERRGETCS